MFRRGIVLLVAIVTTSTGVTAAGDNASPAAKILLEHFRQKTPIAEALPGVNFANAYVIQAEVVGHLGADFGPPIGYKAALTNPAIRERLNATEPVRGILLDKMLLHLHGKEILEIPANFAAVPRLEGDLLVRVGDDAINDAKTDLEILQSLDAVIPFVELPDAAFDAKFKPDVAHIIAANAGARLGVAGTAIPLTAEAATVRRLESFRLEIVNETGKIVAAGIGGDLMGQPLNVVRWLRDSLRRDGKKLHRGQLLSLGSLTPMLPVKPGSRFEIVYLGLAEAPVKMTLQFDDRRQN